MKLKSFFANTIEEAIRLARHELGPDAMLVNSKRSGAEARHLGFYEVVVCSEGPEMGPSDSSAWPRTLTRRTQVVEHGLPGRRRQSQSIRLSQDVSELKQRMEKLALTLARSGRGMASVAFDPGLSRVFTTLTDAELDTELAYDVVGKLSSPVPEGALRAELAKLVSVDAELGSRGGASRVVALVGPPGAGKTSALVKLAVQYGVTARKTVQVLTTDTYRIAAAEELRSYAAILGIGCQVLETAGALVQALDEYRQKDLILIDTPGLCRVRDGSVRRLGESSRHASSRHRYPSGPASLHARGRPAPRLGAIQHIPPAQTTVHPFGRNRNVWAHSEPEHPDGYTDFLFFARPAHSGGSGAGDEGSHARSDSGIARSAEKQYDAEPKFDVVAA